MIGVNESQVASGVLAFRSNRLTNGWVWYVVTDRQIVDHPLRFRAVDARVGIHLARIPTLS